MILVVGDGAPPPQRPLIELEQPARLLLRKVKSPKFAAFPKVEIVIYCIVLTTLPGLGLVGFAPPAQIPRVELEQAPGFCGAFIKSPKLTASPVDAIVMYSMVLTQTVDPGLVFPPPKIPRVSEPQPAELYLPVNRLPKSVASPVDAMVTKSIVSLTVGD